MGFKVVIPVRYASSRLPGKSLLLFKEKPIVQHVYENSFNSGADQVIIATDDQRIVNAANKFNAEVCVTSKQHHSGSDRIAEVVEIHHWDPETVIVNVQGDEPLMPSENIKQVSENLSNHADVSISTLCTTIQDSEELNNPNVVKTIFNENNLAITFSRNIETINAYKNNQTVYRHLGIYAYRAGFLQQFVQMPVSKSEQLESLEQMRAMDNGKKIFIEPCRAHTGIGVDTQEDYEALLRM